MLRNAESMRGYTLGASDGEIGKVSDLYFDDETFTVRYVVVQTGNWLNDKRVLIAPRRVGPVEEAREAIDTDLTRAEVKASPPAESDKPLSERMDVIYHHYYLWPLAYRPEELTERGEVHLRSMEEVEGYVVAAKDGDIGHVKGFIVDDEDWVIRYLVVGTGSVWSGKHVLMSPEWIEEVDWNASRVRVNLVRAAIKDSPEYDTDSPVTREYESNLCRFYNLEGYWTHETCPDDDPSKPAN